MPRFRVCNKIMYFEILCKMWNWTVVNAQLAEIQTTISMANLHFQSLTLPIMLFIRCCLNQSCYITLHYVTLHSNVTKVHYFTLRYIPMLRKYTVSFLILTLHLTWLLYPGYEKTVHFKFTTKLSGLHECNFPLSFSNFVLSNFVQFVRRTFTPVLVWQLLLTVYYRHRFDFCISFLKVSFICKRYSSVIFFRILPIFWVNVYPLLLENS